MTQNRDKHLEELENRFSQLETKLRDTPEKEAISILHAILLETRASQNSNGKPVGASNRPSFEDVANLYKSAPGMQGAAENEGLSVGIKAPDFTLPDANDKPHSLSEFHGKNVVLVFYPLDWSPACSDQLSLYQSDLAEFKKYNAQVIGISVDSIYSHGAWAAVRGISFPLLSDFNPKGDVANRYHVLRNKSGFSDRALFVIDTEGIIRYRFVSPELPNIPDIYELFDQLKSLNDQAVRDGKRP
ncbi:MAG: peroxiredoxin [Anaerolineaceae bacterium]|nr:peroxiredoxin [Anaerolineaceae bacterium]